MESPWRVAMVPTSIGTFRMVYRDGTIHSVDLLERGHAEKPVPVSAVRDRGSPAPGSPPAQLKEYFDGKRTNFEVEFPEELGTEFYRKVWSELCKVPRGTTVTYGELARRAGRPGAARAVGGAMARNPIPIIIPCHRVVGDDRSLTGFGLGLWRKRWLLDHEGAWPLKNGTPYGPMDPAQTTLDGAARKAPAKRPRGGSGRAGPARP